MLSLLKKPASEASEPALPAWHPDFRNYQRLPDTKVVRTSFLVNGIMLLVAGVAFIAMAYRVYEWRELSSQVTQWEQQIDRDKTPSAQAVVLYKKFQAEAANVAAVNTFLNSRPIVSELLLQIAKTLPDYVAIDRFDLGATHLNVRGTVRGAPDQASGRASSYLQILKSNPFLQERFSEINLLNLNRDPKSGGLTLELSLKLKEPKKS
jgi:hypothetical protein